MGGFARRLPVNAVGASASRLLRHDARVQSPCRFDVYTRYMAALYACIVTLLYDCMTELSSVAYSSALSSDCCRRPPELFWPWVLSPLGRLIMPVALTPLRLLQSNAEGLSDTLLLRYVQVYMGSMITLLAWIGAYATAAATTGCA